MFKLIPAVVLVLLTGCGGGAGGASATVAAPAPSAVQAAPVIKAFSPSAIVLEGDSLVQVNMLTSWPVNTQLYSPWSGATWSNFAIGGSTTTQMLARYSAVRAAKTAGAPGVLILNGGSNDLNYPAGVDPAGEIYGRLKSMWSQARADGYKVVAFTIHGGGSVGGPDAARTEFAKLNTLIRSESSLYDALVENDKLFPDRDDRSMLVDGLHFTQAANEKERAAVEAALATLK